MSTTTWEQPADLVRVPMSYEEYLAIPEDIHAEWVDGVVVMAPTATYDHNEIQNRLWLSFRQALPGTAQMTDTTIYLPHDRERRPDVAVLAKRPQGSYPRCEVDGPPLIIVEVLSKSTQAEDWIRKSHDYAIAGVGQYWLVDLTGHQVTVLELADGEWRSLLVLDAEEPTGEVRVGEHGTVSIDLDELFDV